MPQKKVKKQLTNIPTHRHLMHSDRIGFIQPVILFDSQGNGGFKIKKNKKSDGEIL